MDETSNSTGAGHWGELFLQSLVENIPNMFFVKDAQELRLFEKFSRIVQLKRAGAREYLTKPFQIEQILRVITEYSAK